jgi:hypothetical protein
MIIDYANNCQNESIQRRIIDLSRSDTTNDTDKPLLKSVLKTVGLLDSAFLLLEAFL